MWAATPGHIPSGLRAQQGVNTHIQGPTCAQHTTPETVAPKTQTTSPTTPHFQHFSPKWSAFWALHPPSRDPIATGVESTEKPQDRDAAPALVPGQAPDNFACNSKTQVTQRRRSIRTSTMPEGNCMRNYYGMGGARPGCSAGGPGRGASGRGRSPAGLRDAGPAAAPEGGARPGRVPVGGGRARAGLEIDHSEPRARVWRSLGRATAHEHTRPHWCGGRRRDRRARAGFEARRRTK